jgi:hypothetical protein
MDRLECEATQSNRDDLGQSIAFMFRIKIEHENGSSSLCRKACS